MLSPLLTGSTGPVPAWVLARVLGGVLDRWLVRAGREAGGASGREPGYLPGGAAGREPGYLPGGAGGRAPGYLPGRAPDLVVGHLLDSDHSLDWVLDRELDGSEALPGSDGAGGGGGGTVLPGSDGAGGTGQVLGSEALPGSDGKDGGAAPAMCNRRHASTVVFISSSLLVYWNPSLQVQVKKGWKEASSNAPFSKIPSSWKVRLERVTVNHVWYQLPCEARVAHTVQRGHLGRGEILGHCRLVVMVQSVFGVYGDIFQLKDHVLSGRDVLVAPQIGQVLYFAINVHGGDEVACPCHWAVAALMTTTLFLRPVCHTERDECLRH
eukprot:3936105-Rhodomonas_salina.7